METQSEQPRLLLKAAGAGDLEKVTAMLDEDPALVRARDADGSTALHYAAWHGHREVVELLLARGADLDAKNTRYENPPITMAWENGKSAMVDFLLSKGAAVNIVQAATFGKAHLVRGFLKTDPSLVNLYYRWGTPLHAAVLWGHKEVVQVLLESGADLSLANRNGEDVFSIAEKAVQIASDARNRQAILSLLRRYER